MVLDLGAAGNDPRWDLIARWSTIVAVDADSRDFAGHTDAYAKWGRAYTVEACVTDAVDGSIDFYLTRDPHCSSSLAPQNTALQPWMFSPKFEVVERKSMSAISIGSLLDEAGCEYVDWIKLDTQGTDLRLLKSIPNSGWRRSGAIQMEPGILDAYSGEDKLHDVLRFFEGEDFFVADLDVRGTQRIDPHEWAQQGALVQRWPERVLKPAAGWAEVTLLRSFPGSQEHSERELLWGWICAMVLEQWGHAIHIANVGEAAGLSHFFPECRALALQPLSGGGPSAILEGASRAVRRVRSGIGRG